MTNERRSVRTAELLTEAARASGQRRTELLDEVVHINLRVAHAIARRFEGRQIPLEDLEQVAALALVRSAARFDLSQDRDFLSYAVPSMTGEVKRYFRDHGWTVRPPRRIQEIHAKVNRMAVVGREDGTAHSPSEIAAHLQLDVADVEEALRAKGCFTPMSLDRPISGASGSASGSASSSGGSAGGSASSRGSDASDQTFADLLRTDDAAIHDAIEARTILQPVLRRLSERDRRILALRFAYEQTQQEIGDDLGISQMQVSRLITRILNQVRDELTHPSDAVAATRRASVRERR